MVLLWIHRAVSRDLDVLTGIAWQHDATVCLSDGTCGPFQARAQQHTGRTPGCKWYTG